MSSKYSLDFQIWSSLALGAFLVAYLMAGRNWTKFAILYVVSFIGLALLFFGFVRVMKVWKHSGELYEQIEAEMRAVRSLSRREAEEKALGLLTNGKHYRIVENPVSKDSLPALGPELQKFFSRFEEASEIRGETNLNRNAIGPSSLREGFLKIGTDIEHTEIVVRPHEDGIYIIDGTEPEDQAVEESFETIYHYLAAGHSKRQGDESTADE